MASRNPVRIFCQALPVSGSPASYTVPANARLTISAATLNNTTGAGVTSTVQITPNGGSALQFVSALNVPASGAAPTTLPGLVGQTLTAGDKVEAYAASAASVNFYLSGYLQE